MAGATPVGKCLRQRTRLAGSNPSGVHLPLCPSCGHCVWHRLAHPPPAARAVSAPLGCPLESRTGSFTYSLSLKTAESIQVLLTFFCHVHAFESSGRSARSWLCTAQCSGSACRLRRYGWLVRTPIDGHSASNSGNAYPALNIHLGAPPAVPGFASGGIKISTWVVCRTLWRLPDIRVSLVLNPEEQGNQCWAHCPSSAAFPGAAELGLPFSSCPLLPKGTKLALTPLQLCAQSARQRAESPCFWVSLVRGS